MASHSAERPLPDVKREGCQPFWEGARRGELLIQRCGDCGTYIWYPQWVCHNCNSTNLTWQKMSGRGKVFSWIIVRHAMHPYYLDKLPVVVALVELEEAPEVRLTTNLPGCDPTKISIGMPVEVCFEQVNEEVTLPQFRPVTASKA